MSEDNKKEVTGKPGVSIKFLFAMCNDIDSVRNFYSTLLGLDEYSFMNDENWGWLCYKCESFEFMWFRSDSPMPVPSEFTWQPGCGVGELTGTSWAVHIPWEQFSATVNRLSEAKVRLMTDKPQWRQDSYWGFTVLDPMGNTVEVYSTPPEKPEKGEWEG